MRKKNEVQIVPIKIFKNPKKPWPIDMERDKPSLKWEVCITFPPP